MYEYKGIKSDASAGEKTDPQKEKIRELFSWCAALEHDGVLEMLLQNSERAEQIASFKMIGNYSSYFDVKKFMDISENDFAIALQLSKKNKEKARVFFQSFGSLGMVLRVFYPENPLSKIAWSVFGCCNGVLASSMVRDLKKLEYISQKGGEQWLENRLELLATFEKDVPGVHFSRDKFLLHADTEKLAVFNEIQDQVVKNCVAASEDTCRAEDSVEEFKKRIVIYRDLFMHPDVRAQMGAGSGAWGKLMKARTGILLGLVEHFGNDAFIEVLTDENKVGQLAKIDSVAELFWGPSQKLEDYAAREQVAIEVRDGVLAREAEGFKEFLAMSGLGDLARRCIGTMVLADAPSRYGSPRGTHNTLRDAIRIHTSPSDERYLFVGTIVHEIGHAVNMLFGHGGNQKLFDQYALSVIFGTDHSVSSYPDAVALAKGRLDVIFLKETFAEDFRVYLFEPTRVPEERRRLIDQLMQAALPEIDIEELRGKLRRAIGNLYGLSAQDTRRPVGCSTKKRLAMKIERTKREEERNQKKPFSIRSVMD
jgi:hypothetical protein